MLKPSRVLMTMQNISHPLKKKLQVTFGGVHQSYMHSLSVVHKITFHALSLIQKCFFFATPGADTLLPRRMCLSLEQQAHQLATCGQLGSWPWGQSLVWPSLLKRSAFHEVVFFGLQNCFILHMKQSLMRLLVNHLHL